MGRFAPTPSGELHLGSLFTATASYLDARARGGRWLLRIEDLDPPREVPGAAAGIVSTLEQHGFEWDGPIVRQSERSDAYSSALRSLDDRGLLFECSCSRLQLEDDLRYPGTCRERPQHGGLATATRVRIAPGTIDFADRIQGRYRQDVAAAVGDAILRRRDRLFAYLLAVVVDDGAQGVTHIVRGADLLDNTPRQIHLQRLLGLPAPAYAHVPILTEPDDSKLAKSRRSAAVTGMSPQSRLLEVFALLGLDPPPTLRGAALGETWNWAVNRWDIARVPKRFNVRVTS